MPEELKRISGMRIENYYKAYRKNYPNKGIESARKAALNWAIGIHRFLFGDKQLNKAAEEYKKFIYSLR